MRPSSLSAQKKEEAFSLVLQAMNVDAASEHSEDSSKARFILKSALRSIFCQSASFSIVDLISSRHLPFFIKYFGHKFFLIAFLLSSVTSETKGSKRINSSSIKNLDRVLNYSTAFKQPIIVHMLSLKILTGYYCYCANRAPILYVWYKLLGDPAENDADFLVDVWVNFIKTDVSKRAIRAIHVQLSLYDEYRRKFGLDPGVYNDFFNEVRRRLNKDLE